METKPEPKKRIRRDPETTRGMILDMTEKLMVAEGYAAVTTRRIAQELGLNSATIHYYYPTTDDLFIALHGRMTDAQIEGLEAVLVSDEPLRAFWDFQSNWAQTALGVEFVALANHRKTIGNVIAGAADAARDRQSDCLDKAFGNLSADPAILPPIALATILVGVGRLLANEERVGITRGHAETRAFIDWALGYLTQLQQPARDN